MALERRRYSPVRVESILTACPFCGYEFSHNEHRCKHYFEEHTPEDAGLSPIGESDQSAQAAMFLTEEELKYLVHEEEAQNILQREDTTDPVAPFSDD